MRRRYESESNGGQTQPGLHTDHSVHEWRNQVLRRETLLGHRYLSGVERLAQLQCGQAFLGQCSMAERSRLLS